MNTTDSISIRNSNPHTGQYSLAHHVLGNSGPRTAFRSERSSAFDATQNYLLQRLAYEDLQQRRKKIPEDTLLDYSFLDKGFHALKTIFSTLPKTIVRGLKGADDYTFADAMLVTKVPYYLGGAFLALSPFLGGNKREGIRQTAAMLMYLAGTAGTHFFINTLYRLRYGVDLTMMYRSKTGQVEHVFASSDFPRFDLLTPRYYHKMGKKMGIPQDVYEPDGAVREKLRHIITSSRALKLVVANLLSAIGAGYIARSNTWLQVPDAVPVIRSVWKDRKLGTLQKLGKTLNTTAQVLRAPFLERFDMLKAAPWQRVVVYGGLAALAGTVLYICINGIPKKQYSRGTIGPLDEYAMDNPGSPFRKILYPTTLPSFSAGRSRQ